MVYEGLIMSNAMSGATTGATLGTIAGPIGTAVGAIGGALIGALGSNASSKKQYKYQSALQAQAAKLNYDYSLKSAENMPTYTRKGLESAGYNPMLAVQNSTSGANSSWTSAGNATAPDYAGAISQGVANAQSFQRLKNETIQAETQSKANEATAENQISQAMNNIEENKYIGEKRKAEISNITGDTALKEAQIDNMKKQIELGQMGITVQQVANSIQAERNEIERKGNLFRTVRDFGDKYHWSPRQFGEELGRRYAKDHFGRFYKGQ